MSEDKILHLGEITLDSWSQGTLYGGSDARLGKRLGLKGLGATYNQVEPGKSACPFHNHYVEDEMFVILEGEGTYRLGPNRFSVRAGHVLGAPAGGPETAHQLINTGSGPLRYLVISTMAQTEICQYPDSGKFLAQSLDPETGNYRFSQMVSGEVEVDYWQDEPGA